MQENILIKVSFVKQLFLRRPSLCLPSNVSKLSQSHYMYIVAYIGLFCVTILQTFHNTTTTNNTNENNDNDKHKRMCLLLCVRLFSGNNICGMCPLGYSRLVNSNVCVLYIRKKHNQCLH